MNKKIRKLLLDIYYVMDSGRHHKWFLCLQWENHIVCITNSSDSSFTNLEFRTYDFLAKICHDSFLNRQTEENSVLFRPRRNSWKKLEEQIGENIWWIRYYIVQGRWRQFKYGRKKYKQKTFSISQASVTFYNIFQSDYQKFYETLKYWLPKKERVPPNPPCNIKPQKLKNSTPLSVAADVAAHTTASLIAQCNKVLKFCIKYHSHCNKVFSLIVFIDCIKQK